MLHAHTINFTLSLQLSKDKKRCAHHPQIFSRPVKSSSRRVVWHEDDAPSRHSGILGFSANGPMEATRQGGRGERSVLIGGAASASRAVTSQRERTLVHLTARRLGARRLYLRRHNGRRAGRGRAREGGKGGEAASQFL